MMACIARKFCTSVPVHADFSHVVIGAGVVGLQIGVELSKRGHRVLMIERNETFGMETSSRNSEVIHAGLYYPPDSLKAKTCLVGKEWIYAHADKFDVKQCGKWVVAQDESQMQYLETMHARAQELGVETQFVGSERAKELEGSVVARAGVLSSPSTGIVSSHGMMSYLETQLEEHGGEVVYKTSVVGIEKVNGSEFVITTSTADEEEEGSFSIKCNNVIASAGLGTAALCSMLGMETTFQYAKGNYFSYHGPKLHVSRLVYPCPTEASLGTHLTLDMDGCARFGPDLQWVHDTDDYKVSDAQLAKAVVNINEYLPMVQASDLSASYCGIRPKLGRGFHDFGVVKPMDGVVVLAGIESPGLTASYGLALEVIDKL